MQRKADSRTFVYRYLHGLGALLLLASGFLLLSPTEPLHAQTSTGSSAASNNCTNKYPSVPIGSYGQLSGALANPTYANAWQATTWLKLLQVPIGPSQWQVFGRYKTSTGDICYDETWKLQKVVRQGSGKDNDIDTKGMIIDQNDQSGMLQANSLSFDAALNVVTKTVSTDPFYPDYCDKDYPPGRPVTSVDKSLHPECFVVHTKDIQADQAFGENATLDPVGLYGAVYDAKDSLEYSTGFLPIEWDIYGEYLRN